MCTPVKHIIPWAHAVLPSNAILIGSATFAELISVPNTHRHRDK